MTDHDISTDERHPHKHRQRAVAILLLALSLVALGATRVQATVPHLGYGFNVANIDWQREQNMGFNWIKVFGPPGDLPLHILVRFDANAQSLSHLGAFLADLDNALNGTDYVDAWEIGNEVNLDASYGWNAPPDAAAYKTLLCAAYTHIKQAHPNAIVVSAGLAPTGRVSSKWNDHPGHNGKYQDEREYLREFLEAGGGNCLDVVGYHPYGFSADYNAAPDMYSTDPTRNCVNGFCFRGVEKIYAIMQAKGLGNKKVWATEFGWITNPPDYCKTTLPWRDEWSGRLWQIVSEEKQAWNLAGAFQYADAHWPWMGAMFVFNLNFNVSPTYPDECEQMRYYSVQGRPAEQALTELPKNIADVPARLKVNPKLLDVLLDVDWQPVTQTVSVDLSNWGWQPLQYTVTVNSGLALVPNVISPTGSLGPTAQRQLQIRLASTERSIGVYTGALTFNASSGTLGVPKTIPIELRVMQDVYPVYLPAIGLDSP